MEIARAAGAAIMPFYEQRDIAVRTKSDASPVTAADEAADDLITRALRELTPAIPVPAGANRLEVELTGLPAARVGTLISIISSAALVLVLIAGRRRRAFCHRQGAERPFVRSH